MNTLWIIFSVLAFSAVSLLTRLFQVKGARSERDTDLFQSLFCLVSGMVYFFRAGTVGETEPLFLLMAGLFGVFFAFASLFSAVCFRWGPMSLTSVIVNGSVVFPVLYSCLVFGESITSPQIVGCLLLLITFCLSAFQSGGTDKKVNIRWLFLLLIAFFSNGATAVIQKQFKVSLPQANGSAFMSLSYITAAVVLLFSFFLKKRETATSVRRQGKELLFLALLIVTAGLSSFIGNGVLLELSTKVPAALLYPFVNGGLCVAVSIGSVLFFREKLTWKKTATIVIGLLSVIVLNI